MRKSIPGIGGVVLFLLVTTTVTVGDESRAVRFTTAKAKAALLSFERKSQELKADFEKQTAVARKQLTEELTASMKEATQNQNLDEAIRIREEIACIKATDGQFSKTPFGTWAVGWTEPGWTTEYFTFDGDGKVKKGDPKGKERPSFTLSHRNDDWFIEVAKGRFERFTFAGEVLFVEHFAPESHYPDGPARVMGRGKREQ